MKIFARKRKGMTLIELMMAMVILVAAMGGFSLLFMQSLKNNAFTIEEGMTSMTVSRAVDGITNDLRRVRQGDNGDFPLVFASDFDIVVYTNIDDDVATERVHYFLEGDTVKKGVANPLTTNPVTYPVADDTVTVVASYVVNGANEPLFSYYNKQYPGDTHHNPLTGNFSVSDVRLIRVWIRMNIDPIRAPNNINIESFAELRNLNDY